MTGVPHRLSLSASPLLVPDLAADELHAWSFPLDRPAEERAMLERSLDDAERAQASRFAFEVDRERFVVGRGMVRRLLGGYTGIAPERLRFSIGSEGKPALCEPAQPALEFNFSNSHALGLLAVGRDGVIGADVEVHRALSELEALARRHFAPAETARLLALPPEQHEAAFHACWTRKEAMVKALGGGLSIPLDGFEVEFRPSAAAALLTVHASVKEARRWTLWNVDLGAGVSAAVICRNPNATLRLFEAT